MHDFLNFLWNLFVVAFIIVIFLGLITVAASFIFYKREDD